MRYMMLMAAAAMLLSACTGSEVRQSMGMKRNNPDEFQVVSRPPLSVPPVYHLRPPSEEAVGMTPADERAGALVFENKELPRFQRPEDREYMADTAVTSVETSALGSQADSVLLNNAGASQADPRIRTLLKGESETIRRPPLKERSFLDKMKRGIFLKDEGDPVVDAAKEQERIRANKAENKPLTEGETPVIDPKDKGIIDTMFE
jgi:hypothetical protein